LTTHADDEPDQAPDETPDETLVERVVAQDVAAFEILHARYEDPLRVHLVRMVRDPHAADDLLQEAFLRLWTRAEQFHGRGSFKAWLLRVGTNLALNSLRSQRRRRESPLEIPIDLGDPDDDETFVPSWMIDRSSLGPDETRERMEERRRVRDLVDGLPESKREAIRLIYEADMDVRKAAAALAIPEGTVKSRLHHATKTLASKWERMNNTQGGAR
jgi:RNA polymerase sigma-70 factor, ECF subfamily